MGIFLTPLVKSEINWFYSCEARQRCISSFDSGWQPVKVLWIFHCLKNEAPPPPSLFPSPSFLSFFLRLVSNPLCLQSYLPHTLFVSSCFFHLPWCYCCLVCYNGFSLTLTSPSSSMSTPMCLNASRAVAPVTLQTHYHRGYLELRSQHGCQFQSTHRDECRNTKTMSHRWRVYEKAHSRWTVSHLSGLHICTQCSSHEFVCW